MMLYEVNVVDIVSYITSHTKRRKKIESMSLFKFLFLIPFCCIQLVRQAFEVQQYSTKSEDLILKKTDLISMQFYVMIA